MAAGTTDTKGQETGAPVTDAAATAGSETPAAAGSSSPGPTPEARVLCGAKSVYNDTDVCGLAPGHRNAHHPVDATGKVTGTW